MANSSGRLYCHDWIKKMRKQMDISKKDLERDLKREPIKSSNLPVIDLSPSKKQKKKLKKKEKKERYKLAYWYIHQYLKPQYADNIYDYFDNDLDQIVEFGYKMALDHIQNFTYDPKEKREWTWEEWNQLQAERRAKEEEKQKHLKGVDIDHAPGTPAIYINENADIPEIYWSAFEHYCDLHPVKNAKQAKKRRIKFIKMVNKQYKKTYGHMATGKIKKGDKWDTVKYASVCIDKERMMENLKRIRKENVARMDYMKKQMEKWIKTNQISSEAGQKMLAHARKVRKNMQERLDDLVIDVRANGFPDVPLPDS